VYSRMGFFVDTGEGVRYLPFNFPLSFQISE